MAMKSNCISSKVILQERRTLFYYVFLLYYISSKSGFDELFSKSWQIHPAIFAHKTILIPINVFLANDFCLLD